MKYLIIIILGCILLLNSEKEFADNDLIQDDNPLFPLMSMKIQRKCCDNVWGDNPYPLIRYFEKDTLILSAGLSTPALYSVRLGEFDRTYYYNKRIIENDSLWYNHYFPKEIRDSTRIRRYKKMKIHLGDFASFNACYLRKEGRNIYIYMGPYGNSPGFDELLFFFSDSNPKVKWVITNFPTGGIDYTISLVDKCYFPSIQDTLFTFKFQSRYEVCFDPRVIYVSEKYGIVGYSTFHCHFAKDPRYVGDCETWYYPYQ